MAILQLPEIMGLGSMPAPKRVDVANQPSCLAYHWNNQAYEQHKVFPIPYEAVLTDFNDQPKNQ